MKYNILVFLIILYLGFAVWLHLAKLITIEPRIGMVEPTSTPPVVTNWYDNLNTTGTPMMWPVYKQMDQKVTTNCLRFNDGQEYCK